MDVYIFVWMCIYLDGSVYMCMDVIRVYCICLSCLYVYMYKCLLMRLYVYIYLYERVRSSICLYVG